MKNENNTHANGEIPTDVQHELEAYANKIVETHRQTLECNGISESKGKEAIQSAISCGNELNKAKELLTHGQWLPWLSKNCPDVSDTTAKRYMRLAKSATVTDLSGATNLNQAYIATGIVKENKMSGPGKAVTTPESDADKVRKFVGMLVKILSPCTGDDAVELAKIISPICEWSENIKREQAMHDEKVAQLRAMDAAFEKDAA